MNISGRVERDSTLQVLKPPQPLTLTTEMPKVFLAGSIEQGKATNWQEDIVAALEGRKILVLNPRRDQWDSSWKQEKNDPNFRTQVNWELDAQERADHIVMFFEPTTYSPISLLELGLFASSGKLLVCCPSGFWRKGNVEIVCERFNIPLVESLKELMDLLKERI